MYVYAVQSSTSTPGHQHLSLTVQLIGSYLEIDGLWPLPRHYKLIMYIYHLIHLHPFGPLRLFHLCYLCLLLGEIIHP